MLGSLLSSRVRIELLAMQANRLTVEDRTAAKIMGLEFCLTLQSKPLERREIALFWDQTRKKIARGGVYPPPALWLAASVYFFHGLLPKIDPLHVQCFAALMPFNSAIFLYQKSPQFKVS